jgi:hypothetical protein
MERLNDEQIELSHHMYCGPTIFSPRINQIVVPGMKRNCPFSFSILFHDDPLEDFERAVQQWSCSDCQG